MGTCQDITERKKIEEALHSERGLLKKLFDTIPVLITMYKPNQEDFSVNKEFERVIGYSVEEIKDIDLMEECYPDPDYRKIVAEFMSSMDKEWRDFTIRTKNGRNIDTTWTNIYLSDNTHIGIGIDITDRKLAEVMLQESKTLLFNAFNNSPLLMTISDMATGKYIDVNDSFCLVSEFSREETIGKTSIELGWLGEEDWRQLISGWKCMVMSQV